MMPTTREVIASMQLALKEHVEPQLTDKWASSALRSVDALLNHLQARVPVEGPMLHEDSVDLLPILQAAKNATEAAIPALDTFLSDAPDVLRGYASVERLQAINHTGREAVGVLLENGQGAEGNERLMQVLKDLKAYLRRHAEREIAFFFPVFVGRPV